MAMQFSPLTFMTNCRNFFYCPDSLAERRAFRDEAGRSGVFFFRRKKIEQGISGFDLRSGFGMNFSHAGGAADTDGVFHLHRLDDCEHLSGLDMFASADANLEYTPRKLGPDGANRCAAGGSGLPQFRRVERKGSQAPRNRDFDAIIKDIRRRVNCAAIHFERDKTFFPQDEANFDFSPVNVDHKRAPASRGDFGFPSLEV